MACLTCGEPRDLRGGFCFDCASAAEERAYRSSISAHLCRAFRHLRAREWREARYRLSWAFERLTKTGDYTPGGYFETEYGPQS